MTTFLSGRYPASRLRRNRRFPWIRRLVAENAISISDLILPVFVSEIAQNRNQIESMPDIDRITINMLDDFIGQASELGIPAVMIFPEIDQRKKTTGAGEALNPDNIVCQAIHKITRAFPDIGVICDAALDPFNSEGHDGLVINNYVANDETIDILCKQSVIQAKAGCHLIAPSDMMDGRVGAIRLALDEAGFSNIGIMSYAAKYASNFFAPFRDAIGSQQALKGDKKSYQLDPRNIDEAIRQVGQDIQEGADIVIVKPGMPYLDVVHQIKSKFGLPTIAYQVSGEYAMLKGAIKNGWLDDKTILESMLCFKRAGADAIISYFAIELANMIKRGDY